MCQTEMKLVLSHTISNTICTMSRKKMTENKGDWLVVTGWLTVFIQNNVCEFCPPNNILPFL